MNDSVTGAAHGASAESPICTLCLRVSVAYSSSLHAWRLAMLRLAAFVTAVLSLSSSLAFAGPWDRADTHTVRNDAELRSALRERIPPGATLLIAPGKYTGGIEINSARGAEGKPIVIAAADPKQPP